MGIKQYGELAERIAKECNVDVKDIPEEALQFFAENARIMLEDKKLDKKAFRAELDAMSEDELSIFVPDVYQQKIEHIDYAKLKEKGIKLISFDIDDTIGDCLKHNIMLRLPLVEFKMKKYARDLFRELKNMGFIVVLLTNAVQGIAIGACNSLKADGYVAKAKKPQTASFETIMERYHLDRTQMAHVGNSMRDDIVGGNRAGVTTCLVRRRGIALKIGKGFSKIVQGPTKGHLIREKLLEHGMWHKHHERSAGDQYYQLGEVQKYTSNFRLYQIHE